jgi:hypothetical protein
MVCIAPEWVIRGQVDDHAPILDALGRVDSPDDALLSLTRVLDACSAEQHERLRGAQVARVAFKERGGPAVLHKAFHLLRDEFKLLPVYHRDHKVINAPRFRRGSRRVCDLKGGGHDGVLCNLLLEYDRHNSLLPIPAVHKQRAADSRPL